MKQNARIELFETNKAIDTENEFFSTGGIPTAYWGVFQ